MLDSFCRHYRSAYEETPTYTGGISKEARDRMMERMQKNRDRAVLQASSKDKRRDRERDPDEKGQDRHRHSRDRGKKSIQRDNSHPII